MSSLPIHEDTSSSLSPAAQWASHLSLDDSFEAAFTACAAHVSSDLGKPADLAFVFVSGHHPTVVKRLPGLAARHLPPHTTVVGCTAGGVIGGGQEAEGVPAVSVTAACLPDVGIHAFHLESEDMPDLDGPPSAWETWIGVPAGQHPSFILLPDPFTFDIEACLQGLDFAYPAAPKLGGLASGARRPGGNLLFLNDQVWHHGLVGLAVSGPLQLDPLVAQGCRPVGEAMVVTECHQNLLLGLNHERPLTILQSLLPNLSERDRRLLSGSLFLGLVNDPYTETPGPGDFLIRNILGLDAQRGAMAVGALLRTGQRVQFHLRDAESSAQELESLTRMYRQNQPGEVTAALLFSCLGRGRQLYGVANHDSQTFERCVAHVPVGGFFCNGEIGPVAKTTYVHGYTSSFAVFRAAARGR